MLSTPTAHSDDLASQLGAYAAEFDVWLAAHEDDLQEATRPIPKYADRVGAMSRLMAALYNGGWARFGWPIEVGGLGGDVLHRAAMWDALARRGVMGMALFEHLEILTPTLIAMGPRPFVAEAIPAYLSGRELWCRGFSEPDAGSDLPSAPAPRPSTAATPSRAARSGPAGLVTRPGAWSSLAPAPPIPATAG